MVQKRCKPKQWCVVVAQLSGETRDSSPHLTSPARGEGITGKYLPQFTDRLWRAGFTLIELFIVAAILSLVVGGIFAVMNVADKSWHSDMGLLDLQQQARLAMDGMVREIRQADPEQNIIIGSGGSSLQFYIANITDSTASPINYNLSGSQIIREHPLGVNKILANDISALNFSWVGGTTSCLQVQVRASKTVKQRVLTFPLSAPLTEEVKLRNE